MKYYINIIAALAAIVLASCVSDEDLSKHEGGTKSTTISFNGSTGKLSRAAGMRASSKPSYTRASEAFTRASEASTRAGEADEMGEPSLAREGNLRADESRADALRAGELFATRAGTLTGPAAAERLNDQFVVYGTKSSGGEQQTVFDHYTVNYIAGSEQTSASNTHGWEYVGQPLSATSTLGAGAEQSIKLWDLGADQYDFVAFSTGTATLQGVTGSVGDPGYPGTPTDGSVIATPVDDTALTTAAYTLTGRPADLTRCLVADRVTATKGGTRLEGVSYPYLDPMTFAFRQLGAKIRLGLYETIEGYSVKDVKFYAADDTYASVLSTTPLLFGGTKDFPSGVGTITVSYPETDPASAGYNKVHLSHSADAANLTKDVRLPALEGFAGKENLEGGKGANPGNVFLGRSLTTATTSPYQLVVPTGTRHALTLKMDYTLLSTDISKETIEVRGATAIIPADFCTWQPNTAYTYLFKISGNTSGWTNPDDLGHAGLYPVTFDAIVAATEEGVQQSITLMAAPSITTYAKGERVHEDGEKLNYYEVGDYNLYICLQPSSHLMHEDQSNVRMFKATTSDASLIVEANVEDVIKNGTESPAGTYTYDKYTLKTSEAPALEIVDAIVAEDAPYGTAIGGNFARFQPTAEGTYVFEYTSEAMYYEYDEYTALAGNEGITPEEYQDIWDNNKPALLKPNKHYKVIVVK